MKILLAVILLFVGSGSAYNGNLSKSIAKSMPCDQKKLKITGEFSVTGVDYWFAQCANESFRCSYVGGDFSWLSKISCESLHGANTSLRMGMSKNEVKLMLGEPQRVNQSEAGEQWIYPDKAIHFEHEQLVHWLKIK